MSKIYPTKHDLSVDTRKQMVAILNETLASSVHMSLQAKQAHWNVKGMAFFQLHELFDKVYAESTSWVDTIAERAAQLGGVAEAGLETIQQRSKLPPYRLDISDGRDHVDAISRSLATLGTSVREAIGQADRAGDAATADLFTEVSRGVDQMLWFVEAHLQSDR